MTEILVARSAGFCMGVRRAIEMALEVAASSDGPVYTNGPLIHNPQALRELERRGVVPLAAGSTVPAAPVIVRAHGVPPEVRQRLEREACRLVDATCPKVATIQARIAEFSSRGYSIIIAGDADHPEVVGLLGHARREAFVVSRPEQVAQLPDLQDVMLVSQTTQDQETFEAIRTAVLARFPEAECLATICQSTHRRQTEVRELAAAVDAVVVIGGRNSANTRRLAAISEALGTPAFHVETAAELPLDAIAPLERIGVTAGASTPADVIQEVVATLQRATGAKVLPRATG